MVKLTLPIILIAALVLGFLIGRFETLSTLPMKADPPDGIRVRPLLRTLEGDPLTVRDAVTQSLAALPPAEQRKLLGSLVCAHAAPGDAVLFAACTAETPSMGVVRKVERLFHSSHSIAKRRAAAEDEHLVLHMPGLYGKVFTPRLQAQNRSSTEGLDVLSARPLATAAAVTSGTARNTSSSSGLAIRALASHAASRAAAMAAAHNAAPRNAPRWLDHVRPTGSDWHDLSLQPWELAPILAPAVPRGSLPMCVWERLARLCAVVFPQKPRAGAGAGAWYAEWNRGVTCSLRANRKGEGGASRMIRVDGGSGSTDGGGGGGSKGGSDGMTFIGRIKPTSTEAENAILLEPTCDDTGSGTQVSKAQPRPGESSLPINALIGAVEHAANHKGGMWTPGAKGSTLQGKREASDGWIAPSLTGGARMASLRAKLTAGRRVRILAIGASNTAMFAPACVDAGCEIGAREPSEVVHRRLQGLADRHGALGRGQPDWLVRLLLTLHARYPDTPLLGVAQAYGGLDPKTVASCLADFLEGGRPFVSLSPRCKTAANSSESASSASASSAAVPSSSAAVPSSSVVSSLSSSSCSDAVPDLLLLDFAIFAGKRPTLSYLVSLEKLLRFLYPKDTAVLFLNMANWCRGSEGVVQWEVMGHAKCQRMLFDPERSVANLGRSPLPDPWHSELGRLARHYGYAAVSTFHALAPLVITGQLNASAFTQDGMHPIYWPRKRECIRVPSTPLSPLSLFLSLDAAQKGQPLCSYLIRPPSRMPASHARRH